MGAMAWQWAILKVLSPAPNTAWVSIFKGQHLFGAWRLIAGRCSMVVEQQMEPVPNEELEEDIEFLRGIMSDPARFEKWANDTLDRSHRHNVGRKKKRR